MNAHTEQFKQGTIVYPEVEALRWTIQQQRDELDKLRAENERLKARKCSHGDYRIFGTDDCRNYSCNHDGRTELYIIGDGFCIACQHEMMKGGE